MNIEDCYPEILFSVKQAKPQEQSSTPFVSL